METKMYIDFENYKLDWVWTLEQIANKMGIKTENSEFNVMEFTGEKENVELFRKLVDMSDGGNIL